MTERFTDRDASIGMVAALMTLTTLLEQRGVLDREQFARMLEGITAHHDPAMQIPAGMKSFLEFLVVGLRTKNFENLPPAIQMIYF